MKESEIEAKLVQGVKALGGKAYKFISPGNVGVPDRIVIMPDGLLLFVELKTETGRLSKMQERQIAELNKRNMPVQVLYGLEQVNGFLQQLELWCHRKDGL